MENLPQKKEEQVIEKVIPNKHAIGLSSIQKAKVDNAPIVYKCYLVARYETPRMVDLTTNAAKNRINEIIMGLFARSIYRVENVDTNYLRDNIYNDLLKHFPDITIGEIREGLEVGMNGFYENITGKLLGVNVSHCMQWIKAYMNEEKRKMALKFIFEIPKQEPVKHEDVKKGLTPIKKLLEEIILKEESIKRKKYENLIGEPLDEQKQELNWLKIFDAIWFKQKTTLDNGTRYISRYGKKLAQEDYMQHKANQRYKIQLIKNHKNKNK